MNSSDSSRLSLRQLQTLIKERLDASFPLPVWVTAEISEMKVNYSGHCYLELIEKNGENQSPQARCNAVIWRSVWGAISSYFQSATGGPLQAGMKILVKATVIYSELYGLSLQISDIDPTYTIGDMERQRQETIRRLREEGVYDMNRELGLPAVVQRVAVISSRNAAGYQDFTKELDRSPYRFEVVLFDAFMQGAESENSIIGALERVLDELESFDVVVVIRGGGSQSDLSCFDSYRLASHLAQFPLPVVTGIGHDKDESVADLVASVALKTPTAVAGWLIEGVAEFDGWLSAARDEISSRAADSLEEARRTIQRQGFALSRAALGLTRTMELRLERLSGELVRREESLLTVRRRRIDDLSRRLAEGSRDVLRTARNRIRLAESLTETRKPDKILSLGFAVVRRDGRAVKTSGELRVGQSIEITLSEGRAGALVESVE